MYNNCYATTTDQPEIGRRQNKYTNHRLGIDEILKNTCWMLVELVRYGWEVFKIFNIDKDYVRLGVDFFKN